MANGDTCGDGRSEPHPDTDHRTADAVSHRV
jgi:hypothetical protein